MARTVVRLADQSWTEAYAQLLADEDTLTAVAAAYSIADQAAVSEAIIAQQDQAVAQADSALVLAASEAAAQASAQASAATVANATAQPLTVNGGPLTITGEAPSGSNVSNLTVSAPITIGYSISNITANGTVWTVTTTAPSGLAANASVTISGVTPTAYDGNWTVASASTTTAPYTFTITSTTNPGPAGFGGTAATVPAAASISSITASGSAWTVTTTAASGLAINREVTISGATQTGYDGTWTVAMLPRPPRRTPSPSPPRLLRALLVSAAPSLSRTVSRSTATEAQ